MIEYEILYRNALRPDIDNFTAVASSPALLEPARPQLYRVRSEEGGDGLDDSAIKGPLYTKSYTTTYTLT